jgi:hypothetical protein
MPEELPLRDIITIEPGWWPPAPIWWLLAAVCLILLWKLMRYWLSSMRSPYGLLKKAALSELAQIQSRKQLNKRQIAEQVSALLKRVAIRRYADKKPARLSGERWLAFLNDASAEQIFSKTEKSSLANAQYLPSPDFNEAALFAAANKWIRAL